MTTLNGGSYEILKWPSWGGVGCQPYSSETVSPHTIAMPQSRSLPFTAHARQETKTSGKAYRPRRSSQADRRLLFRSRLVRVAGPGSRNPDAATKQNIFRGRAQRQA